MSTQISNEPINVIHLEGEIPSSQLGARFDQCLADLFPAYSRSRIKTWILAGQVKVDGKVATIPKEKMMGGEQIEIAAEIEMDQHHLPEKIALDKVYEDDAILVINKPRGLVVHPGAGNQHGTLLNALLYDYPALQQVPRAGIVHRLDKETTGLMVIAKTIEAQTQLVDALQRREITREYEAVAMGNITAGGTIDEPMARHPTKRTQMSVYPMGKPAVTHYRVMERFRLHTRLRLRLETGRTHQIRVHMAYIAHPLLGDPVYGGRPRPPKGASEEFMSVLRHFDRQALHATMLRLYHPVTGELMEFHADLPEDMQTLIAALQEDTKVNRDKIDWL